jgi:hypothetical protein
VPPSLHVGFQLGDAAQTLMTVTLSIGADACVGGGGQVGHDTPTQARRVLVALIVLLPVVGPDRGYYKQ